MNTLKSLVVIGVTAALFSCGDDPKPAAPAAAPAAPAPAPAAPKPAPLAAALDGGSAVAESSQYTYTYNPIGKRDPFRSPIDERKNEKGQDQANDICPEPLCQFDLEQLSLVAVVSGDANPVAMLEDTTRVGHIVRRNTKVGKQGGKVTQILRDCIEVTEFFLSPDGKKIPNRVSICVKKDDRVERAYDLFNNKATE